MEHKIKTVKEFIKDGPPQFDVILRHEKGEPVTFSVSSESEEIKLNYMEMTYPEPDSDGIIKIVKRICDDVVFHTNDMVEASGIGSCFIIGFSEDLIHCIVVDIFSQEFSEGGKPEKIQIQINHIVPHDELDLTADEYEGIEGGGEDHWPEQGSAIDEW